MTLLSSNLAEYDDIEFALKFLPRALDLAAALARQSYFLIGPRQTGKSTLIRETLPDIVVFNLLNGVELLALTQNPLQIESALS